MSTKLKYIYFLSIFLFAFNCIQSQKEIIIPLTKLNNTDTILVGDVLLLNKKDSSGLVSNFILNRTEYFLIKGYTPEMKVQVIDRYVRKNKPSDLEKFNSFAMIFIKESAEINEKNVPDNAEMLETPGFSVHKDFIFSYSWENGILKGKLRFENGKITDKKN